MSEAVESGNPGKDPPSPKRHPSADAVGHRGPIVVRARLSRVVDACRRDGACRPLPVRRSARWRPPMFAKPQPMPLDDARSRSK